MKNDEILDSLKSLNKKLELLEVKIDGGMAFAKANAYDLLCRGDEIYFVMKNGLEVDFSITGVTLWADGKAKIKLREKK